MTLPTPQQIIDEALMAGAVYISTRNVINQIPTPSGWNVGNYRSLPDGFEAVSFQQGKNIVISFAGTGTAVDWLANAGGALGATRNEWGQTRFPCYATAY
ncbi:MAG: hypothetical protein WBX11_00515 [Thiobacillaceae bacterium]